MRKDSERPLRVVQGPAGSVRLSHRIDGLGTVGAFPGASLLYVEGRAKALLARDEKDHGLAGPGKLRDVEGQVVDQLGGMLGCRLPGPAALRRADLTGELFFERGEHGRELLAILDGLHSARYRTAPVREQGGPGIETAYWRTPKRSIPVLRAYDKGLESATAAAGERVRIERQLRYGGAKRPSLNQWLSRDLAGLYVAPLRGWMHNGVAAGTAGELLQTLIEAAELWPNYWASGNSWASGAGRAHVGMWSARRVERIIGTLAVVSVRGAAWGAWPARMRQRRMAEVRELGLLVTDEPVIVDVDEALGSLCDLWAGVR